MKSKFLFRPLSLTQIIERIEDSESNIDLKNYENILFSSVVAPMLILASIANIFFGFFWGKSLQSILIFTFSFLLYSIGIFYSSYLNINYKYKVHISSFFSFLAISTTIYLYYENMGFLLWFIIFIITILATTRTDKTLIIYTIAGYIMLFTKSFFKQANTYVKFDYLFFIVLVIMIIFIIISSLIINVLYRRILSKKIARYNDLLNQKEEIKESHEKLKQIAYNDSLTGLPNRKMVLEQLNTMINLNSETKTPFAMVFVDLDNFKRINDTLGHFAGDEILCQVSNRLKSIIDSHDLVGRLGGDELALLIRRNITDKMLLSYIEKISSTFEEPFEIQGKFTKITASFGIATFPYDAETGNDLLKAADTAMYKSKELGKNTIQFYQKEMKKNILLKIELENRLIHGIKNKEFFLEYQPFYDTKKEHIVGFEALIRWNSPSHGILSPANFIPIAEETGLIDEIGKWVIEEVCKKVIEIKGYFERPFVISINVSPVQIKNRNFLSQIKNIVENTGVDPSYLEFEITESIFIHNIEAAIEMIKEMKSFGFRIALDDFGTGYSSLSYLTKLPIDTLKIDKSFIDNLNTDDKKNSIVGSIISLVHNLDMKVIAEGVENDFQMNFLKNESCDIIQGFLLSHPLGDIQMHRLLCNYK